MSNGFRSRMSGNGMIEVHNQFLQEQLADAQQSLFFAKSVREMQFLQSRINYLKQRINEGKKGKKKSR